MDNQSQTRGKGARCIFFCKDHKELVKWYKIFLGSSRAIALSLDPLFFFVPVIHEDKKCISEDKIMWINAVFWRSFLDFIYMVHSVVDFYIKKNKVECLPKMKKNEVESNTTSSCSVKKEEKKEDGVGSVSNESVVHDTLECGHMSVFQCFQCTKDETSAKGQIEKEKEKRKKCRRNLCIWMRFVNAILVILPFPQVLMSNILLEMRRAKYTNTVTILNAVILIQYGPRILQIYLSLKELEELDIPINIRASFNFFLYLLAGHVFGAFWYFISTQRLISCWRIACLHQGGCVQGSFNCDHRFGNLSALQDFCSIDSTNTSTFDFGIFLEARQSGILESMDFPKKLIYSAWWGLRNLSSFGSNLQTSTYIWENAFALGISIFGLLLFLYFLGNLQVYMQGGAEKSMQRRASESIRALESIENSPTELVPLYKQRSASKSIEISENERELELDDAVVEKLLKELGQLYKQRSASKSIKKSEKW